MVNSYKAEGIILKRINFRESDKMITIFAKDHGKIKAVAKGVRNIRSRRAPHLELFNYSRMYIHKGRNVDIISEAETINTFSRLKKDLEKVATAYYMIEIVDRLCPERQEHNLVIYNLINSLSFLDTKMDIDLNNLIEDFSLKLIIDLGYLPKAGSLQGQPVSEFIEGLIENKLKTVDLLTKLQS